MLFKKLISRLFILTIVLGLLSCSRKSTETSSVDIVLIGGGIMSATLGSILSELAPEKTIAIYERLDAVAKESSSAWNNAGTGHQSYAELNYTPMAKDGSVDINKAIAISESFELSKQYWAYQVQKKTIPAPKTFINPVPHMSLVFGEQDIAFLKQRFLAMHKHPFFSSMQYSEDPAVIRSWIPLMMEGRSASQKVAATKIESGTDVNFGALTHLLFNGILKSPKAQLHLSHEVQDISRNQENSWHVTVKDLSTNKTTVIRAKFVFVGAGGGALPLLQKSGIDEAKGYGGFPVGGAWLVTENQALVEQHNAKVYGQASVGSPPMSVPHLDTRVIDGKRALLFGPFATYSTKFLKTGSWLDLPLSISFSNAIPMLMVGLHNFDLLKYLVGQVIMSEEERFASLREYVPNANISDWREEIAGQRVQVIKKDEQQGGVLQFGTELVSAKDGTIIGLLGASPGASTAVPIMLEVLKMCFAKELKSSAWQQKLKEMIPSYGQKLADDETLFKAIRLHTDRLLQLNNK